MLGDFSDPVTNIGNFGIRAGMVVADIGSGSGHYAIAAAQKVGDEGKVYALEVQRELADRLRNQAQQQGLKNLEVLWANAENVGGTHLAKDSVDFCIVANVLFQMSSKTTFAQECFRILKPGALLGVVDWSESFGGFGPHSGYVVSKEDALRLFEGYGFVFEKEINAGAHHWGIIFKKAVV